MASQKEIKDRMKSIQDTLKITNAMYMISSSKLQKAKKVLSDAEPYFYTLRNLMARILRHVPDMESRYFQDLSGKDPKDLTVAYVVVSADKGMAGAYNQNILKEASSLIRETPKYKLYVMGEMGRHYCEARHIPIDRQFHYTVQKPTMSRARRIGEDLLQAYLDHEFDVLKVVYTKMDNSMSESVETIDLLPFRKADFTVEVPAEIPQESVVFDPSPEEVIDHIVPDYLIGYMYGILVEAFSAAQNARMMAMQSSSDNARKMLASLTLAYNRARQAAITQEITEVAAGARAMEGGR